MAIDRVYDWSDEQQIDKILYDFNIPYELLGKVLLVSGESHTGQTMELFRNFLKKTDESF